MGSTKYLASMGELSRKDNSLCFRKEGKNTYIAIENIKELYCLNEISINSKLLDFLSQKNIILHFFNYYGGYSGTFYPREKYQSGKLLVKQVKAFEEKRLDIAKAIVMGIGKNIAEVLYHYYKHDKKEVKETIDWIKSYFAERVDAAQDIPELMSYEGEVWSRFYNSFRYFLPEDFIMNKRVKRPPDNPMNAMISFGNTLLYTKTVSTIYQTHILVERTIFDLVNNKKIQVEKHFDKKVNYCLLNEEGRNIFIDAFEKRVESTFQHKRLKRRVSYRTAIKLDCYKLIKCILEDEEFQPFSIKEGI